MATLGLGTRVGPYEIVSAIGAGGMGEIYKARDTRLDRTVALKVLPPQVGHDAGSRERFQREARAVAALNHPHICTLHDVGCHEGIDFLVMEYLEGETLAARLAKGPLEFSDAVEVAIQLADALDQAHRAGIVHRDIKPQNVMLTTKGPSGTRARHLKLLDFGIATASAPPVSFSARVTQEAGLTAQGTVVGTVQYMAPEYLEGKEADTRTDIYAFGILLYEMVTGQQPFVGSSHAALIAAILNSEPARISTLKPGVPPSLDHLIQRCLVKDPDARWQSIRDVKIALEGPLNAGVALPATRSTEPRLARHWLRRAFAGVLAVAFAALLLMVRPLWRASLPETRVDIATPATDDPASFALSPDGRQIVFVASRDGVPQLWLRSLSTATAQPLAGTDGGSYPFWSPDGRSVAFFAASGLKRLDLTGGQPQTLAPAPNGSGGTWSTHDVILFAPSTTTALVRVSAKGGSATAVTTLGQHAGHVSPHFLPDGTRFLFYVQGAMDDQGIYLGAIGGGTPTRLTPSDSTGVPLLGQWLLWVREGILVAQRLDVAKAALTGDPVTVADALVPARFRSAVSVAATGLVAYRTGSARRQLIWVDRSGTERGTVGSPDSTLLEPRVSPDGKRVVVGRTVEGNQDLWLIDGPRTSRFTSDASADRSAAWSPDSGHIAFHSSRTGIGDLYLKPTNGAGAEERLVASDQLKAPGNWSADGRYLLFHSVAPPTDLDLWVMAMTPNRRPSVVLKTPFRESYGVFSPDSRWVAYQSNDSGRYEIYVRPFAPPSAEGGRAVDARWQVSTAGGVHPVWRPDGKELYYLDPQGIMMAASIAVSGATLEPASPVALFTTRAVGGGGDAQQRRQYDVAPNGLFLINTELDTAATPITLLMNWVPEAKK